MKAKHSLTGEMGARAQVPYDDSYKELIENGGVLDRAKKIVEGRDKQQHYGPPEEFMARMGMSWTAYLWRKLRDPVNDPITPFDAAMMMGNLKSVRLGTDPEHEDSLDDYVGYGLIGEKVRPGRK